MRPTQHPSNNRVLGAPTGWNQQELPCNALAITDVVIDGHRAVTSFWRPSQEELTALASGGLVMLSVVGTTMPPAIIEVTRPE